MLKGKYKVPDVDASFIYRTCTRKKKFISLLQASNYLRSEEERKKLHIYPCKICQFFHIGHIQKELDPCKNPGIV